VGLLALGRRSGEGVVFWAWGPTGEPIEIFVRFELQTATKARLICMAPDCVQVYRDEIAGRDERR
jgi:sRNA-binding carbon storage regulator CsrA